MYIELLGLDSRYSKALRTCTCSIQSEVSICILKLGALMLAFELAAIERPDKVLAIRAGGVQPMLATNKKHHFETF